MRVYADVMTVLDGTPVKLYMDEDVLEGDLEVIQALKKSVRNKTSLTSGGYKEVRRRGRFGPNLRTGYIVALCHREGDKDLVEMFVGKNSLEAERAWPFCDFGKVVYENGRLQKGRHWSPKASRLFANEFNIKNSSGSIADYIKQVPVGSDGIEVVACMLGSRKRLCFPLDQPPPKS